MPVEEPWEAIPRRHEAAACWAAVAERVPSDLHDVSGSLNGASSLTTVNATAVVGSQT